MLVMKSTPFNTVEEPKQMYELVKPEPEVKQVKLLIKDPEEKEYLGCFTYDDEDTKYHNWLLFKGRTEIYNYIIGEINNSDYDSPEGYRSDSLNLYKSFILVEGAKLEERVILYDFMKYCKNFYNDGFNIDDYIDIDDKSNDESSSIENPDSVDNNLLNMISIMNRDVIQQDIYNDNE